MSVTRTVCIILAVGAVVTACGDDGPDRTIGTAEHPRVVEIKMVDIGYEPSIVRIETGETIEFDIVNTGALDHEAVFGDLAMQEEHEIEMQEMGDMAMEQDGMAMDEGGMAMDEGGMGMGHDEGVVALAVAPGHTEMVLMSFDEAGHTLIGCHQPGHWDAGMRVDIDVT